MSIETKAARIKSAKPAGGYKVRLRWINGESDHTVDLAEVVTRIKGLRPVRDETEFAKVTVGEGGHSLGWPGELDIGADLVYELDLQQNGQPGAAEFVNWQSTLKLSLSEAAEALGISRRSVANYRSGDVVVPRYITLACIGYSMRRPDRERPSVISKHPAKSKQSAA